MLELQIALGVMAVGLLGIGTLMVRQGKQIRRAEGWCTPSPTYRVISQADSWLQALGAPADLETDPGATAWVSPISQNGTYRLLLESRSRSFGAQNVSVTVKVYKPGQSSSRRWLGDAQWWQVALEGQ